MSQLSLLKKPKNNTVSKVNNNVSIMNINDEELQKLKAELFEGARIDLTNSEKTHMLIAALLL